MVSEMFTVTGTSRTSEVKIGKIVKIKMPYDELPLKEVEQFLVTGVTHTIDELGHYSNTFTGIISDLEAIPMELVAPPHAYPQQATVMDNADPENKGRVQVQLQWQKSRCKNTNWIRVASPDAGSSGTVPQNRGFVFIPEVGDQVMVGFEYGDPNRPYVMSSLFTERTGAGGGIENIIKSIISRSGHTFEMNDDEQGEWSITLKDANGNIMHFDTKGKNIEITAPETVTINAKNVNINADENMNVNVGKNLSTDVGADERHEVRNDRTLTVANKQTSSSGSKNENVDKNSNLTVGGNVSEYFGKQHTDVDGDIRMYSGGKALIQGAEDARITRG